METSKELIKFVMLLAIALLVGLIVFGVLIGKVYGSGNGLTSVKVIVCRAFYLIPFGGMFELLTHSCDLIPA